MALTILHTKILRLCAISQFRNAICVTQPLNLVQPTCGLKQSVEEKLGLPKRPKRPMSPFLTFFNQIRPNLLQENPNLKLTELSKLAGLRWEKVDPKIKAQLESEFKEKINAYNCDKIDYENNLTTQQKHDIKEAKLQIMEIKEKKMQKKKTKDLGRPKRPPTSYIIFSTEKSYERGNIPMKEWLQKIGKEWEMMSEADKAKYVEQAKNYFIKYQEDLSAWEKNMIKLGHVDVVRTEALKNSDVKK